MQTGGAILPKDLQRKAMQLPRWHPTVHEAITQKIDAPPYERGAEAGRVAKGTGDSSEGNREGEIGLF